MKIALQLGDNYQGTLGGAFATMTASVVGLIDGALETVLYAIIGAVIGYLCNIGLKWLEKKFKKWWNG